jgi:hypothetical protein
MLFRLTLEAEAAHVVIEASQARRFKAIKT